MDWKDVIEGIISGDIVNGFDDYEEVFEAVEYDEGVEGCIDLIDTFPDIYRNTYYIDFLIHRMINSGWYSPDYILDFAAEYYYIEMDKGEILWFILEKDTEDIVSEITDFLELFPDMDLINVISNDPRSWTTDNIEAIKILFRHSGYNIKLLDYLANDDLVEELKDYARKQMKKSARKI